MLINLHKIANCANCSLAQIAGTAFVLATASRCNHETAMFKAQCRHSLLACGLRKTNVKD
jgi:hypothetical protein